MRVKFAGRREFLASSAAVLACACSPRLSLLAGNQHPHQPGPYVCPPCGCAMDGREFASPGACPACGMALAPKSAYPDVVPFEPSELVAGTGVFRAAGGLGREDAQIDVHYHKPSGYTSDSNILLIIPGAGRNADSYRDAWIDAAETCSVLVAALGYREADYDFAAYHMGGVVKNLEIGNMPVGPDGSTPDVVRLRDEDIIFELNPNPEEWLFNDFDRIFGLLARAVRSSRDGYDLFGHSAGGQILHRSVLFRPHLRADRIVAANAGFYTLPDPDVPPLLGVQGAGVTERSLAVSFSRNLTLLLGEEDDGDDAGGTMLHTPLIDAQGQGRLTRGRTFFEESRRRAESLGAPFNWSLRVVPGVGHDHRAMAQAAARLLYR